ncbi:hypothetical protein FDB61_15700 [Clostridium botulinum]|nr:hypothetical protein [Clostridium botulinum]
MNIILQQLGGNKFIVMTGAKNIIFDGNKNLQMSLPSNMSKANRLSITLEPSDTYKMIFSKFTPGRLNEETLEWIEGKEKVIKIIENVYCDMLQNIFTQITGMYTKLSR